MSKFLSQLHLYTYYIKENLTVRSITQAANKGSSLLVLLVCLCKSFKELFSGCLREESSSKAGAKVRLFFELTNIFATFFQKNSKKDATLDQNQESQR